LLSLQRLHRQIAKWEQSDVDHHPEHYRYSTWREYLETLVEFPVELLDVLLALDLQEAGLAGSSVSSFGHGIAHDLAKQPALTLEGLARLRRHPCGDASFARALDRAQRQLNVDEAR
jgi:hypothetical protein